jgi:arylsulfatase A-like enzyme
MQNRPNILFVFSDQQRYEALGSSGNRIIKTPNFDKIAEQGIVFDQALASHPLCAPYRAQLMTGRYSHANGVVDNDYKLKEGQAFLGEVLKRKGYHTGYVGKWHLGHAPYPEHKRYGFDCLAGYVCGHAYYKQSYHINEDGPFPFNEWAPQGETSLAIQFLENHKEKQSDSPFALFLSWGPPHWPYDQYPKEYKMYDPATVPLPENVPAPMAAYARQEIADYYGNITGLDAQMGRLLETLDRLGYSEDTIVVFTSDHGDHLRSHGYGTEEDWWWMHDSMSGSKGTPYEESIHVPFVLRYPGRVKAGARTSRLFCSVDIMPTLLGLCGIEIPAGVQGMNLAHLALGEPGPVRDSVFLQNLGIGWRGRKRWVGIWRGVRTERWLYARWQDCDQRMRLYDREKDPLEKQNLAGHSDFSGIQAQLESRLQQWMADTGDPFDSGEKDPKTGMLLLGQEFI